MTTLPLLPAERASRQMELRGVRVHNLKNIDVDIPLGKLVVLSGVSGSGKSSLAFDTLFAEGQRRYIESFSVSARQHLERIDRPDADRIAHVPLALAIRSDHSRRQRLDSRSTVAVIADLLDGFRLLFSRAGHIFCPQCQVEVTSHSATDVVRVISNLPGGTRCQLGFALAALKDRPKPAVWLARGFSRAIWGGATHDLGTHSNWPESEESWIVTDRIVAGKISEERLRESAEAAFREGNGRCWLLIQTNTSGSSTIDSAEVLVPSPNEKIFTIDGRSWTLTQFHRNLECSSCGRTFLPPEPRLFSHLSAGACLSCRGTGKTATDTLEGLPCRACNGTRYRDEALAVKIGDRSIADFCRLSPSALVEVLDQLGDSLSPEESQATELIRADIVYRLTTVIQLGSGYFTLAREASSLSGGETRRLMLAATIGSRVTGTLVVIDEPSAGLSAQEIPELVTALRRLQQLRNSVVAVEHSPLVVAAADYVIELGPSAGPGGGSIIYQGPPRALSEVPLMPAHRTSDRRAAPAKHGSIRFTKIAHPHLLLTEAEFPLRQLTVVSGPGGSGKTTLIGEVLFPAISRRLGLASGTEPAASYELKGGEELVDAVLIDQLPLAKSSRSNPATWLEVFDEIRQTFAATADAKQKGFTSQSFSFNSAQGGRCRSCLGTGLLKQDMSFLPDLTLACPECGGTRYRREILDVKYRGRSIADVLSMSVSDAASFFRSQPRIQYRFQLLKQIGLDYLVLGQPSETLSGGEAQRLKLAARMAMPNRGPTLIICDEPTTGLHPADVVRLVACFRELLANGHTLVLADNSPELLAAADQTIWMGSRSSE